MNLPLYYFMFLIPPKRNLWVFGAWYGEKYFDNPRFLFEYVQKNNPQVNVVWITKDKAICNNKTILYKYSLKAIMTSIIAEVYLISHSTLTDLYPFINNKTRKVVQLWHGIPIKKIGKDDNRYNHQNIKNKIKFFIFPFLIEKYSLIISSSESDRINMASAFDAALSQVKLTGYPRNDVFYNNHYEVKEFKILYAPTLRDKVDDEVNLFDDFGFDSNIVLQFLEENNIYLDIKMHPANKIDKKFKSSVKSKHIRFLESKMEINEILQDYSIIISDYSGLYIDYLLTDRPIIFAPFDYKKYITKDRELYYKYDDVTPGPKCRNWNEVLEWIIKFKENPELYKEKRKEVKDRFHKYQDGNSCERVYREILKLVN